MAFTTVRSDKTGGGGSWRFGGTQLYRCGGQKYAGGAEMPENCVSTANSPFIAINYAIEHE